ncbi:MAG: hypothetical protein C4542_09815 [Dehalococcoidia bacterium]|nr:MAG: hypothetical protein C4542_09815 [Dehalococcoidia bacterium]
MTPDEVQAARGVVAEKIGESADKISIQRPRWMELMTQGVIVQLHLGRWRAQEQLSAKSLAEELGLDITDEAELEHIRQFLAVGAKRLLPLKYIHRADAIDAAARTSLEAYSYKTGWGRFVPATMYGFWKERNATHEADYYNLRDEIVKEYEAIRQEVISSYRTQAGVVYDRMTRLGMRPDAPRDEFIEQFTERVSAKIRTPDEIYRSFYYRVELSYIPLPAMVSGERADQLSTEMTEWATARLDRAALEDRKRKLDEMNADILASFREQKEEQVDAFLKQLVRQLRSHVYETAVNALESIKRNNGKLMARSANSLRSFIATTEQMNFYSDPELNAALDALGKAITPAEGEQTPEQIEKALQDLGILCRAVLLQVGETPRSGREVGIADVPDAKSLRATRKSLGVDPTENPIEALGLAVRKSRRSVA